MLLGQVEAIQKESPWLSRNLPLQLGQSFTEAGPVEGQGLCAEWTGQPAAEGILTDGGACATAPKSLSEEIEASIKTDRYLELWGLVINAYMI